MGLGPGAWGSGASSRTCTPMALLGRDVLPPSGCASSMLALGTFSADALSGQVDGSATTYRHSLFVAEVLWAWGGPGSGCQRRGSRAAPRRVYGRGARSDVGFAEPGSRVKETLGPCVRVLSQTCSETQVMSFYPSNRIPITSTLLELLLPGFAPRKSKSLSSVFSP